MSVVVSAPWMVFHYSRSPEQKTSHSSHPYSNVSMRNQGCEKPQVPRWLHTFHPASSDPFPNRTAVGPGLLNVTNTGLTRTKEAMESGCASRFLSEGRDSFRYSPCTEVKM